MYKNLLNAERALIFRIVHQANIPRILSDGCHCRSAEDKAKYVEIGNPELIQKRTGRVVTLRPRWDLERLCSVLLHPVFSDALQHQDWI